MEELHVAAKACLWYNASSDVQRFLRDHFCAMDTDGDGLVSFDRTNAYFLQCGYNRQVSLQFFSQIDRNRDGRLDFWEFLTLCYIMKTRDLRCNNCRSRLMGLYFTCYHCFDHGYTYNLCSNCYGKRCFQHNHASFVDSYGLLRHIQQTRLPVADTNQGALVPSMFTNAPAQRQPGTLVPSMFTNAPAQRQPGTLVPSMFTNAPAQRQSGYWMVTLRTLEVAISVASIVANCSIM